MRVARPWIPAFAGMTEEGGDARSKPVIPAEAGIQTGYPFGSFARPARLDSRLRGNDG
jgi:hypothetical protein